MLCKELLKAIGTNFKDSLVRKGLNPNQIIVTFVLRTKSDQKRLRRGNGNATENSAHAYATTFDITYKRFYKLEERGRGVGRLQVAAVSRRGGAGH